MTALSPRKHLASEGGIGRNHSSEHDQGAARGTVPMSTAGVTLPSCPEAFLTGPDGGGLAGSGGHVWTTLLSLADGLLPASSGAGGTPGITRGPLPSAFFMHMINGHKESPCRDSLQRRSPSY